MMMRTFQYGLLASAVALLVACGGQTTNNQASEPHQAMASGADNVSGSLIERIKQKGMITVGTEGTYAPFSYHDADGKLTGYDVEVARKVAEKLGVKVIFKETQWDAMLAGLKAGRFDMVANQVALTTPERQATFDKSEAYSWSGAAMLVREQETRIKDLASIKGLKAAQTLSSNYGEMARDAHAEIVPVDGMAQAIALVQQNRADLTLNDALSFLDYLKKNPQSGVKVAWTADGDMRQGSGLIVNKGNEEALKELNQALSELKKDGTLKQLGETFFGKDVSQ